MVAAITARSTRPLARSDSDLLQLAGLEEAQQQPLHAQRHLADLVEKDRALVGELELAGLVAVGAGEAALDVTEQLRLQQRLGHARAVDGHKRLADPWAPRVNGSRDQFLAAPLSPVIRTLASELRDALDLLDAAREAVTGANQLCVQMSHVRQTHADRGTGARRRTHRVLHRSACLRCPLSPCAQAHTQSDADARSASCDARPSSICAGRPTPRGTAAVQG